MAETVGKKRRPLSSENERKRRRTTERGSVNIGKVIERWNEYKDKLQVDTDEKLAEEILNRLDKESRSSTPAGTDLGNEQAGTASSDDVVFKNSTESGSDWKLDNQNGLLYKFGRYGKEFEEIERLGKGGYGSVYKSKNKLDGNTYAVKKIRFTNSNSGNLEKVQREVTALAKLKHANIVRYNTAWIERDERKIVKTVSGTSLSNKNWETSANKGGVFCEVETNNSSTDLTSMQTDGVKDTSQPTVVLYIQMELCSQTLMKWMRGRNEVKLEENENICSQILEAVNYMHCKGVIHRDLKPSNIFLMEGLLAKVGDFGLAKEDLATSIAASPARSESSPALSTSSSFVSDHTSGIGTKSYAAPEQLDGCSYTFKCDIYSLGVIMFELFQFTKSMTEMELQKSLEGLRAGEIPDTFLNTWPKQSELIKSMTSENPESRPSAQEILSTEFSEVKEKIIEELRKQVEELTLKLNEREEEYKRLISNRS